MLDHAFAGPSLLQNAASASRPTKSWRGRRIRNTAFKEMGVFGAIDVQGEGQFWLIHLVPWPKGKISCYLVDYSTVHRGLFERNTYLWGNAPISSKSSEILK